MANALEELPANRTGVKPLYEHTEVDGSRRKMAGHRREKFVMCPPRYLSTKIPNNIFMETVHERAKVNIPRAMAQYKRIVRLLGALEVPVVEIHPVPNCQDQTYTANVAVAIFPYIVIANYKAPGRSCEEEPAKAFFHNLGYKTIQPQTKFEGEADLKKFKDGVYFGGYGKFSDRLSFDWIAQKTGVEIIPLQEISDKLYHLDCSLFVLDEQNILVNRDGLAPESFKRLEKLANIVVIPPDICATGCTNAVKIPGNKRILLSGMFFPEEKKYQKSMDWMNETFDKFNYTVLFMDIDEPDKSGADISCMVMKLDF